MMIMQKTLKYIQKAIFFFLLSVSGAVFAQTYNVGDIYTFPDGSKGVVCYVNPNNGKQGWAMALTDLPGKYAMNSTSTQIAGLQTESFTTGWSTSVSSNTSRKGKQNTKTLFESGHSPAAQAMDVYAGWYIPNIIQLFHIYSVLGVLKDNGREVDCRRPGAIRRARAWRKMPVLFRRIFLGVYRRVFI